MHKKILNLKRREKVPLNAERTYEMENLKKNYQKLQSTIVIHMVHVGEEINMSIKNVSHSLKYHSVIWKYHFIIWLYKRKLL